MNILKKWSVMSLLSILTACGHTDNEQLKVISLLEQGDIAGARTQALSGDFYSDKASWLIRYMDLGVLHYLNGDYYQAILEFDKAQKLADMLYTQSISNTIAANISGDGVADYAGEKYEQSQIRFYQALTHYQLYRQGFYEAYVDTEAKEPESREIPKRELTAPEKRKHLSAARASLLDWNRLLTAYTNEAKDEKSFRQDMLAKSFGAELHDIYSDSDSRNISPQLLKDMEKLADGLYKDYPSFKGGAAAELKKYAQKRRADLPKEPKQNVRLILKTGIIAPKKAEKIDTIIPLTAFLAAGSSNKIVDCLGMILPGQRIGFEIPIMEKPALPAKFTFQIKKGDATVSAGDFVLTMPVSEVAYAEYELNRPAFVAKKTARLTAKYVTAVISACALYDPNNISSMLGAYGAFAASSALIKASEYADLRYWGLLPNAVYQQALRLSKGQYTLEILKNGLVVHSREITVADDRPFFTDIDLPQL